MPFGTTTAGEAIVEVEGGEMTANAAVGSLPCADFEREMEMGMEMEMDNAYCADDKLGDAQRRLAPGATG